MCIHSRVLCNVILQYVMLTSVCYMMSYNDMVIIYEYIYIYIYMHTYICVYIYRCYYNMHIALYCITYFICYIKYRGQEDRRREEGRRGRSPGREGV